MGQASSTEKAYQVITRMHDDADEQLWLDSLRKCGKFCYTCGGYQDNIVLNISSRHPSPCLTHSELVERTGCYARYSILLKMGMGICGCPKYAFLYRKAYTFFNPTI